MKCPSKINKVNIVGVIEYAVHSTVTVHSAEHTTSCKHALKEEWLMLNSKDILS